MRLDVRELDPVIADKALNAVCTTACPYDKPFRNSVTHRVVLALILDELTEEQFGAIAAAARAVGDATCYSAVVGSGDSLEDHWPSFPLRHAAEIELSHTAYLDALRPGTSALISPSGQWCVLVAEDWFGLAAGTTAFAQALTRRYPPWPSDTSRDDDFSPVPLEDQVHLFLRNYEDAVDPSWTVTVLDHVYGEDAARKLAHHTLGLLLHATGADGPSTGLKISNASGVIRECWPTRHVPSLGSR